MNRTVFGLVMLLAGIASAEMTEDAKARLREERRRFDELQRFQTGGDLMKAGVGYIAIVNGQGIVDASVVEGAAASIRNQTQISVKVVRESSEAKGAGATIRLVNESGKPPMLAAPEAGWCEVNIAALGDDLKSDAAKKKFVPERAAKMTMRGLAYATGSGGSGFGKNILDVVSVRELDYYKASLPVDAIATILDHLERRGVRPAERVTYASACNEGWAPPPTNKYQKAVWEKVAAKKADAADPTNRWKRDFPDKEKSDKAK